MPDILFVPASPPVTAAESRVYKGAARVGGLVSLLTVLNTHVKGRMGVMPADESPTVRAYVEKRSKGSRPLKFVAPVEDGKGEMLVYPVPKTDLAAALKLQRPGSPARPTARVAASEPEEVVLGNTSSSSNYDQDLADAAISAENVQIDGVLEDLPVAHPRSAEPTIQNMAPRR